MQFITVEGLMCVCSAVNTKVDVRFHVDSAEWACARRWVCTVGGAILVVSMCHPPCYPADKLSVSFSRSSGPGGQNVNKGSVAERSKALV